MNKIISCSICSAEVKPGGRKGKDGKPPLCARHYHRERRDSPLAAVAEKRSPGLRVHATLPAEVVDRMHLVLAELHAGRTVSEFIAEAVVDAVARAEARSRAK